MGTLLDHVSDGVLVVDADWQITQANTVASTLLDSQEADLVGADVREVFPQSAALTFHSHFAGEDPTPKAVTFEEYFPALERWLAVRTILDDDDFVVYLRDITDRRELQNVVEGNEAELERLNRINAIIYDSIRALVGATTREEIEARVCDGLAASDLYELVWIGEREPTTDRITSRAAAGEHEQLVDVIVDSDGDPDSPEIAEQAVLQTGETEITRQLVGDDAIPEQIRRVAFAHGLQSAIAIPLRYGTTTYGVLGVYATRPDAFSERERESLETLGVATGFVINAARQRNLLLSDTVVELTFRVTDRADVFVTASGQHNCSLTVAGIVPLGEGTLLCYVSVEDGRPTDVLAMASDERSIEDGRLVHETSEADAMTGGLLELTVAGASPLLSLVERGATIRTAEFEDGIGRIVAEVAPDENVRELVEGVGEAFPDSELLAKRERERAVETAQEFRSSLHDRLTDRQQTALRVAYYGGYFKSPRDSTAEELAEGLGISSPTLHHHLRAAQSKLLDAFLDDRPGSERRMATDDWPDDFTEER